uniref:Hypothetical membrane protein n=1 Tax=Thermoplasma acidophilum TaxID=2303 RepID=Q0KKZ0_THEAI|nr:hypothetical membrane protein [Thermoplasma acidophilum]
MQRPHKESRKSKGKRFFIGVAFAVIFVIGLVPFGSYMGQHISDLHQTAVLEPQTGIIAIYTANGTGIPFAEVNGTGSFTMPYASGNATSHTYQHTAVIVDNLTIAELSDYSVSKIQIQTGYTGNGTYILGSQTDTNHFTPILEGTARSMSTLNISIQPQYLTGNQPSHLIISLQSNATAYTIHITPIGNNGLTTIFGPVTGEDVAYIASAIMTFLIAFLINPWTHLHINPMGYIPSRRRHYRHRGEYKYADRHSHGIEGHEREYRFRRRRE